ncbi:MAG: hypothetical protein WBI29_02060 [Candidatus Saccharimonadales bacterium]
MNKKTSIIIIAIVIVVISIILVFSFAQRTTYYTYFNGTRGYPIQDCKCSGLKIFDWCWGELTDCVYMD